MDNRWGLASRSAREASLPPKKTVNDFAAKMGSAALREARQPKDSDEFKLGQPTAVEVPDFIAAASLKDVKRSALPDPAAAFQPSQSDSVSRGRGDGGPGRRGRSVGRAKPNTEAHAKSLAAAKSEMMSLLAEVRTLSQTVRPGPSPAAAPTDLVTPSRTLSASASNLEPRLKLLGSHLAIPSPPGSILSPPVREAFVASPVGPGVLDASAFVELKSMESITGNAVSPVPQRVRFELSDSSPELEGTAVRPVSPSRSSPTRLSFTATRSSHRTRRGSDGGFPSDDDGLDADRKSVHSTATGYGAGDTFPRVKASMEMSKHDKIMAFGTIRPKVVRPTSAPMAAADVPEALPSTDLPPNELLRRLFLHNGIRIPFQYFYRPNSLEVVRELNLCPWRTWVTDAVLIVLAAASGHTNVAWRFMLDNCPAVSDVSLSVLLPRLPKMRELYLKDCVGVGDATLFAVTTKIPAPAGATHGTLLQLQTASAIALGEAEGDVVTDPASLKLTLGGVQHPMPRALVETTARVYGLPTAAQRALAKQATILPCPKLTTINVSGCSRVSDASLLALCNSLTTVTSLNLNGTSITDHGVRELLIKCRWLKQLSMAHTVVSDAAFDQLLLMGRLIPVNPLVQRKDVLASRAPRSTGADGTPNDEYYLLLQDIDLSGCPGVTPSGLQPLLMVCPQLKKLDVSNGPEVDDGVFEALRNRKTFWGPTRSAGTCSLEWLNLSGCSKITSLGVSWLTAQNFGLTHLNISNCSGFDLEAIRALNTLPTIHTLDVTNNPTWHPKSLVWLFDIAEPSLSEPRPHPSLLTTVTSLDLTGCSQLATQESFTALQKLKNLTTFRFEEVPLQPDTTRALFESISNVETLRLPRATGITEQGAMFCLTGLSRLKYVDITGCRGITDKVLMRLTKALTPSIRHLLIGGLPDASGGSGKLTDFSVSSFTNTKVPLEVLDLSWHKKVTDMSVGSFVGNLTSLHTLILTGCPGVTLSGVEDLTEDRKPHYPYVEAVVHPADPNSPGVFKGMRLATDVHEVAIRQEVLKAIGMHDVAVNKIIKWLRKIWERRRRWSRNANVAASKRASALSFQRVIRGHFGRLLAKRERIRQKRLTLLVTREWLLHLKHRREIEAVRMYHRFKLQRAYKRFVAGCVEWIEFRRVVMPSEADLLRKAVMRMATTLRRSFEAFKEHMVFRRKQWEATVVWYEYIMGPRYFYRLKEITAEIIRRRKLRAQAGFMLAVNTACHNSDRQQPGIAKANDRRLLLRTRVPFRAWKTKFMEISHRETVYNRRVCLRPLARACMQRWRAWGVHEKKLRQRLAYWEAKIPKKLYRRGFDAIKEEAYANADDRVKAEEAKRAADEAARIAEELKQRRIELFILTTTKRKPFKGWIVVMKRWQRKRTRWGYAVEHSKHLEKLWAFRDFVRGVVVLKRQRLHMELMMRKALEFMVDGRLARAARIIRAMREYADKKIEKRERRKRILRRALELWTNRTAFSVLRSWQEFMERKRAFLYFVVKMQTLFRRRGPMKYLAWLKNIRDQKPARALQIQRWIRRIRANRVATKIQRMAKLLEYKKREYDWDCMTAEDRRGEGMREVERKARFVQRFWRNRVKLRATLRELRKYEIRERDAKKVKTREGFRWQIDSERFAKLADSKRESAITVIQALVRRFLERSRWEVHQEAKRRQVGAISFQKHWRRYVARKFVESMRRDRAVVDEERRRRKIIGKLLRLLGYKHRYEQRDFVDLVSNVGLDPETYTLGIRFKSELADEWNDFAEEFSHYKNMLLWTPVEALRRNKRHVDWTRQLQLERLPKRGDAVRIVDPSHPFFGFTGLAGKLELSYGKPRLAVRIDRTQKFEYLALSTPPTPSEHGEVTMVKIQPRRMPQLPSVTQTWRNQMFEWAARERRERRRHIAASAIQRAFRNWMAPVFVARQKILDDRIIATRHKALERALRIARMNNVSVGSWLARLGVVRRVDVPEGLVDGPVMAALSRVMSRLRRAKTRREEIFREIRKQRDFVELMERMDWAKMTRWERRRNWEFAPASRANRGFTEAVREWLTLRAEEARILIALDRTAMFEAQTVFRARTQRVVAHNIRNAMRYGMAQEISEKHAVQREYDFMELRESRHVMGHAKEQREEIAAKKKRMEDRMKEEEMGRMELWVRAGMSNFNKYLEMVENMSPAKRREKQREAVLKAMDSSKPQGPVIAKRCGGRGICDLYGTWDGPKPHGVGKAKFLMTYGYVPAEDPLAGDMYDELLCNFDFGRITGNVTIRYHDGSVYEGPYVPDNKQRLPDHIGRRTSAQGVVLEGSCIDNHTLPLQVCGYLKLTMPSGETYDGHFVNGKRHGIGVAVMPDGSRYQGEWKADMFHGWGRRWTPEGLVMDGYWQNGIQQGFGKQKLPQRETGFATYQGQILSGTWTGRGRVEYNDSSIYEGQLAGGMRHGVGILAEAIGVTYTGPFSENKKQGWGSEKMADGSVFDGPFSDNRRHGVGVVTTMVPVPAAGEDASWEMPEDDGWLKDWTVDKPELRGEKQVANTDRLRKVVKLMGWQHLRVIKPGEPDPETLAKIQAEQERQRREEEERQRKLAAEKAARKARRDKIKAARERRRLKEEEKRKRRAEKPVWEDTTTEESGSGSDKEADESLSESEPEPVPEPDPLLTESLATFSLADSSVESSTALVAPKRGGGGAGGLLASTTRSLTDYEVVKRRGRWIFGQFAEWTSQVPSKVLTREFLRRMFKDNIGFDSTYATMIARRLPFLPDGLDGSDLWVQRALREIIFRAGAMLAYDTLRSQEKALDEIEEPLAKARAKVDELWQALLEIEHKVQTKAEKVMAAQAEFDEAAVEFKEAYTKTVEYWRGPPGEVLLKYKAAYAKLYSLIPLDWNTFVKSFDEGGVAASSRAIRLLLDALNDLYGLPLTEQRARMLIQDAGRNSDLGDREASFHDYKVLILHMASKLNPFLLCDTDRPERIARYLAQPEFRTDCADFRDISDAPGTMMEYLLATQRFIIAARPIEHDRQQVHRLRAFMKSKQSVLYLQQEELSEARKKVVEAREVHTAATRELHIILERKEEMMSDLHDTKELIRTGKMPPPKPEIGDLAQSVILERWENRKAAKDEIL